MSTVYTNKKIKKALYKQRFVDLAKIGSLVFCASDLANLWGIKNPNTLHVTLKRYAEEGLIIRIQKGLYSLLPADKIDPLVLGLKVLHRFAYVSAETVLAQKGIIMQAIFGITLISSVSKKFTLGSNNYHCRRLADKYLFNDAGIKTVNGIQTATAERAVADLLYFDSKYNFDAENLIDWQKVYAIQKQIGYPKTKR